MRQSLGRVSYWNELRIWLPKLCGNGSNLAGLRTRVIHALTFLKYFFCMSKRRNDTEIDSAFWKEIKTNQQTKEQCLELKYIALLCTNKIRLPSTPARKPPRGVLRRSCPNQHRRCRLLSMRREVAQKIQRYLGRSRWALLFLFICFSFANGFSRYPFCWAIAQIGNFEGQSSGLLLLCCGAASNAQVVVIAFSLELRWLANCPVTWMNEIEATNRNLAESWEFCLRFLLVLKDWDRETIYDNTIKASQKLVLEPNQRSKQYLSPTTPGFLSPTKRSRSQATPVKAFRRSSRGFQCLSSWSLGPGDRAGFRWIVPS